MHEKFDDDLVLSREGSSFVYESVEECNIHFHKIDLRRGASFIDTPEWLKNKLLIRKTLIMHTVSCIQSL